MRARIAIVHPCLGFGGSEARALWTLEALKDKYGVSLITDGDVDLPRLNEYYGTMLRTGDAPWRLCVRDNDGLTPLHLMCITQTYAVDQIRRVAERRRADMETRSTTTP